MLDSPRQDENTYWRSWGRILQNGWQVGSVVGTTLVVPVLLAKNDESGPIGNIDVAGKATVAGIGLAGVVSLLSALVSVRVRAAPRSRGKRVLTSLFGKAVQGRARAETHACSARVTLGRCASRLSGCDSGLSVASTAGARLDVVLALFAHAVSHKVSW